ncbi:MAG TPA: hypothetical protein PKU94_07785 [Candidatus Hydrothermia bacterium]|nr:hypothetical protein [Candidatus Hydrothermia bacterium]
MVDFTTTVPAEALLRKHNMEYYITENVIPQVPFLQILPTAENQTGEFTSVVESNNPVRDIREGDQGTPALASEASELTTIQLVAGKVVSGNTVSYGYSLAYTDKDAERSQFTADIKLATQKMIAGFAYFLNDYIAGELVRTAQLDAPDDISDWGTSEYDPRADFVKIRKAYKEKTGFFRADTVMLALDPFYKLQEYLVSFDKEVNEAELSVDGMRIQNVGDDIDGSHDFIVLDSQVPPGIIEKYVNPRYSALSGQQAPGVPPALININEVKEDTYPHRNILELWVDVGYNSREPYSVMTGQFVQS